MFDGNEEFIDEPTVIPTTVLKPTNDIEALKERKRLKLKSLTPQEPAPAPAEQPTAPQEETAVTKPKLKKTAPAPVPAKAKAKTKATLPVPRVKGKAATSIKRAVAKGKKPSKPVPAKKAAAPKAEVAAPAKKTKVLSARAKAIIAKAAKRKAPPLKVAAPSTAVSRKGKALKTRAPGSANGAYAQVPKYKCMCCGKPSTGKFFKRGHIWAFNRAIVEIASGDTTPDKALPAFVAKAMGPWTKIKGAGLKPAVASYEKAYAIANAKH